MNIFVAIPEGIVRDTFLTEENVRTWSLWVL